MISIHRIEKVITVLSILAYCIVYFWVYTSFVVPVYGKSEDYSIPIISFWNTILTLFFIFVPVPALSILVKKVSQVIVWIIYIIIYVPLLFMPYFNCMDLISLIFANCSLMIGFLMIIYFSKGKKISVLKKNLSYSEIRPYLYFFSSVILFITLYHNKSELRLANPLDSGEVYSQRLNKNVDNSGVYGYFFNWIASVFTPIFVISGLFFKIRQDVIYGIVICILVYMIGANKLFILTLITSFIVFWMVKKSANFFGSKILWFLTFLMILTTLLFKYFEESEFKLVIQSLAMMVTIRTVGISTYNYKYYYDFFITQNNPKTYLSHISIVDFFTDTYPYKYSLGQVIGDVYFGTTDYQLNANFFISDGLCAFGIFGFIIAGIACGYMLRILDSASQNHKLELSVGLTFYASMNFANVSLFTAFVTGGLVFVILYLYALSPTKCL